MPACFVKAGQGWALPRALLRFAQSSDLPGEWNCWDRRQPAGPCSDFVSKPVSSPPSSTLPKQTSGNTTLPQAYPLILLPAGGAAVEESGLKDPLRIYTGETFAMAELQLRWFFTGQPRVPLPSLSARRMQDAWTQREGTMTNVLEPSSSSLEASLPRF